MLAGTTSPDCGHVGRAGGDSEALQIAYRTNPSLTGDRGGLRAIDEGVPIAKAGVRPALSATADYQEAMRDRGRRCGFGIMPISTSDVGVA